MLNRRHLITAGALAAASAFAPLAQAQTTLAKPARILVGFSAGGAADAVARLLAQQLTGTYAPTVIVDNKPGANGNLGAQLVADAPADGNTILLNTVGMQAINPLLYPSLRYSPSKDFVTLGIGSVVPNVMVVHPSKLGVRSLQDLVALAKKEPG